MAKTNWFNRTTGRQIQKYPFCECRSYGREHCFNCVVQPEYKENTVEQDTGMMDPVWWDRWLDTMLTDKDIAFLTGRKKQWQRAY